MPSTDPSNQQLTNDGLLLTSEIFKKNSIHLYGVDELTTEDIFDFLKGKNTLF